MNASPVDLSICISYYNASSYLARCLASVRAHSPAFSYEVIVIDDRSPQPAAPVAATAGVPAHVLVTPSNVGFARANNLGIRAAAGRYVLILNCDTEVGAGALDAMIRYLETHTDVAAVGPMLRNADGTFQPQCRRGRLTPLTGLAYAVGLDRLFPHHRLLAGYLLRYADPLLTQNVRALSGACMMLRADTLAAVGGFDEHLVQYAEDLDLCYRLGAAGHRIVYLPEALVTHFGGEGGTGERFWRSMYYYHRALWIIFRRYSGPWFLLYGWAVALMLVLRAGALTLGAAWGHRRVGTRKGMANRSAAPAPRMR